MVPFCDPTVQQKALARDAESLRITEENGYSIAVHTGVTLSPPPLPHMEKKKKKERSGITQKFYL